MNEPSRNANLRGLGLVLTVLTGILVTLLGIGSPSAAAAPAAHTCTGADTSGAQVVVRSQHGFSAGQRLGSSTSTDESALATGAAAVNPVAVAPGLAPEYNYDGAATAYDAWVVPLDARTFAQVDAVGRHATAVPLRRQVDATSEGSDAVSGSATAAKAGGVAAKSAGVAAKSAGVAAKAEVPAFARSQYGRVAAGDRVAAIEKSATCPYCNKSPSTQVDHIKSLKQDWVSGGWADDAATRTARVNGPDNLIGACQSCNASKGAREIGEGAGQWWPSGWSSGTTWPFG